MNRTILTVAGVLSASSLLLVDSAIKGTVLLVLATVVTLFLRRDSAATRHLVWLLAIVAMLVVPVLSAMLPQWRVLPAWMSSSRPVVADISPPSISKSPGGVIESPRMAEPVDVEPPIAAVDQRVAALPDTRPALMTPEAVPAPTVRSWNWINALPLVWVVGFVVLMLRLSAARWMLWNSERLATVVCRRVAPQLAFESRSDSATANDPIVTAMQAICSQLGISRPVTLLIHPNKTIPVVWGILRCRLMLPAAARQWSDEQLQSVLLHELAHIKRRDTIVQLLAQVACALHWFNPLVWFAAWRLDVERERSCDDLVLASGVRPSAYAGHLLDVVTGLSPARWTQACGLAMARKSSLEGRLTAVLGKDLNRRGVSMALAGVALAIAVGIAVPIAMLRAADEKGNPPQVAHISSNDYSTYCVHDGKEASFVIAYRGDFGSATGGWNNPKSRTWQNEATLTLLRTAEKREFTLRRDHTAPVKLTLAGKDYDLAKGRVFLLSDDGAVRQIDMKAPVVRDHDAAKKLVALIAAIAPLEREDASMKPKHNDVRGNDESRRFVFPDNPPNEAEIPFRVVFAQIREQMHKASEAKVALGVEEHKNLRDQLTKLGADPANTKWKPYVTRRLAILDWQAGQIRATEVASRLVEMANDLAPREKNLTIAMSLVVDLRARDLKRFKQNFSLLEPSGTEQFGWFVFEYSQNLLMGYVHEGASMEQSREGRPVPEEYRRSVEVADFLEPEFFDAVESYIARHKGVAESNATAQILERSQLVSALKQTAEYLRKILGRRLYLDVSERTTDVLLPRCLGLWASATELIKTDGDQLESYNENKKEIDTFHKSIVPHLRQLQKHQRLLKANQNELQPAPPDLATDIAAIPPQEHQDVALTTNLTGKFAPETIAKLKWGEPVNGLRMALAWPPSFDEELLGSESFFQLVVQNVSNKEIHFHAGDNAPNPRELTSLANDRAVLVFADEETAKADWHLQAGHCGVLRMFMKEMHGYYGTVSAGIERDLSKIDGNLAVAEMEVAKAPAGAWTGKLVTGQSRGSADVAAAPAPMHKDARAYYEVWQRYARANGDIPGALVGELAAAVRQFIKYNPTWETVPKLNALLPRLDATRDWKPADAIALLDEVAGIQDSPIKAAPWRGMRHTIRQGEALPKKFADATWGEAQPNGLRAAWVLEPNATEHRIGAALKARLLVQNTGSVSVVLQVPTWHQGWVKARDAKGKEVEASGLEWTTLAQLVPVRLAPGEYIEINTPGIGFGPRAGMGPWAGPRVGSNVLAKAGDELTLTHGLVPLDGSEVGVSEDDPHVSGPGWWLAHVRSRLNRELPLPADAAERTRLLDRAVRELFATAPSAEETTAFIADKTPDALDALAKRLVARVDVVSFSGKLPTAPAKFRVLAADANADKQPRVVLGPGEYPLSKGTADRGAATLKIVGRSIGNRHTNDAQLLFEATEATGKLPPDSHKLEVPDGRGTWAIVCRPGSGVFYLLSKGTVRKIDYSNPRKVTDTLANDLPAEFRDEVKRQLDIHEISAAQQAEIFEKPAAPAATPDSKTGENVPAKPTAAGTPKLPKLPDDAYAKLGVHCQKFREEDAKRPGGELMEGVLEPSKPADRGKEPLVLGIRTASDAQWRIGGTAKVGLVVRNRTGGIGRDHPGSDVKFSYTGRLDNGLSVVAVDEAGKEHGATIAQFDSELGFQQMLLPVAHVATIKEFTIRFDAEKRGVSEPRVVAFHLPPGKYKLRCKWNDARPDVAHEGEWTGELVNEELAFTLAAAVATPPASETPKTTEKKPFTAWGEEVNGVQIGVQLGEQRIYEVGENVTLILRLRNNGKVQVPYRYGDEYFLKNPPLITDASGKAVTIKAMSVFGKVLLKSVAPGKEVDLVQLKLDLRPATDRSKDAAWTIYSTGKFQIQFPVADVVGEVSLGLPGMKFTTGKLELEVKEAFTAWGKEVGGLQAGLGFRADEKRAYTHGEWATLIVRVRNVGKEEVKFQYLRQFFVEHPPTVFNEKGELKQLGRTTAFGIHSRVEVKLAAGTEIELYELKLYLGTGSEEGIPKYPYIFGTGKFQVQYEKVLGNSSSGLIKLDPALSKLATGKLELEIMPVAPVQQEAPKPGAQLKPATELKQNDEAKTKLGDLNLECHWEGEKDGVKVQLVFQWISEHQQARWEVEQRRSDIAADMSVVIEPNGSEAKLVFRKGLEGEAIQGRLTPSVNGTLRLEIFPNPNVKDPGYPSVKDLVLKRTAQRGAKVRPITEQKLKWGAPVNGLRMALAWPPSLGEPCMGDAEEFYLVVQNVSQAAVRLTTGTAAPNPRRLNLMRRLNPNDETILSSRTVDDVPVPGDWLLQPRESALVRLIHSDEKMKDGRTFSAVKEHIVSVQPQYSYTADMTVEKAPAGAWTGKLTTGETRGSADVPPPKSGVPLAEQTWPMPPWGAEKDGLSAGIRIIGEACIGGEVKAELWVRNSGAKDVTFSQCPRADFGLHVVAQDKDGKEHSADITQFLGKPVLTRLLLPAGNIVKLKEFTMKLGAKKDGERVNLDLPPGEYKLLAVWSDTTSRVAPEGEWTGKLTTGDVDFKLAAAKAGADAGKPAAVPPGTNIIKHPDAEYAKDGFPLDDLNGEGVMWNGEESGLSLGYRITGDEWRILGKELKVELWVRNAGKEDVKFQILRRTDEGLRVKLTGKDGKEHFARMVPSDVLLFGMKHLLSPGQCIQVNDFSVGLLPPEQNARIGNELRFFVSPGWYQLVCEVKVPGFTATGGDRKQTVPGAGEWTGTITTRSLNVEVIAPDAPAPKPRIEHMEVEINKDGEVSLFRKKMALDELKTRAGRNAKKRFTIHADEDVPYAKVVEVVEALKAVGVTEFSFAEARVGDGKYRVANRTSANKLDDKHGFSICRPSEYPQFFTVSWPAEGERPSCWLRTYPNVSGQTQGKWAVVWEPGTDVLWWVDDSEVGKMTLTDPARVIVDREGRTNNFSRDFGLPDGVVTEFRRLGFVIGRDKTPGLETAIGGNTGGQSIVSAEFGMWSVKGTVTDADGKPLANVPVRVSTNQELKTEKTDAKGEYRAYFSLPLQLLAHWRGVSVKPVLEGFTERDMAKSGEFNVLLRAGEQPQRVRLAGDKDFQPGPIPRFAENDLLPSQHGASPGKPGRADFVMLKAAK